MIPQKEPMTMNMQNVTGPTFDAKATRLSTLLSQVATVVKVKSTGLGLRRQDKQAAKESARSHNADTDIVNVNVIRLAMHWARR
jgi:hypothetical protein